jgi:hypothetical protein
MGKKYGFKGEIEEKSNGGSVIAWIIIIVIGLAICGALNDKKEQSTTTGYSSSRSR